MSGQIIMYGVGIEPDDLRTAPFIPGIGTGVATYIVDPAYLYYVIDEKGCRCLTEEQVMAELEKVLKKGKVPKFLDPGEQVSLSYKNWPPKSVLIIRGQAVTPEWKLR